MTIFKIQEFAENFFLKRLIRNVCNGLLQNLKEGLLMKQKMFQPHMANLLPIFTYSICLSIFSSYFSFYIQFISDFSFETLNFKGRVKFCYSKSPHTRTYFPKRQIDYVLIDMLLFQHLGRGSYLKVTCHNDHHKAVQNASDELRGGMNCIIDLGGNSNLLWKQIVQTICLP